MTDWEECQIAHLTELRLAQREKTFQRFGRLLVNIGVHHNFESELLEVETPQKVSVPKKSSLIDDNEISREITAPLNIDSENPRLQHGRSKPTATATTVPLPAEKVIQPARKKPK